MAQERTIPTNSDGSVVTTTLRVDGQEVAPEVGVLRLVVTKELNKVSFAQIELQDGGADIEDFPLSNQDSFLPGKEVEVFAGHNAEEDLIFKGIIVKHGLRIRQNGKSTLHLECKDAAYRMSLTKQNRYFEEITDSAAIEEILGTYSIESNLAETELTHPTLIQYYSYDWDFVLKRAEANGLFCWVDDGVFQMIAPDFDQESVLDLHYGATILAFDAEIDARHQYGTVKSRSWDPDNQELLEVEAATSEVVEAGNLSAASISEAAGTAEYILQHTGSLTEDDLQLWADAKLQKSRLAKIRGRVKLSGFAGVKPANLVTLGGVGERFNGNVFVSGVRHYLANGEWETDLQFGVSPEWYREEENLHAPTNAGLAPGIHGLHIGTVSQVHDDPAGAFRILVNLPTVDAESEGAWCRVASIDAGENRGFYFRPEVGDEVVVGFLNNRPEEGVVLGGLHSSAKPAPVEPAEENAEKGFVSQSELKLLFNEETKSIELSTPEGNTLLISEDEGGISLTDQNDNKLVLNADGITLESAADLILKASGDVKIEGTNISPKASANFKAEGSAGAEISSSATLTLKGSLVQIN